MPPKKQFSPFHLVATLIAVTSCAGFILAGVNEFTRDRIEQARLENLIRAIREVLPPNAIPAPSPLEIHGAKVYPAYDASGQFAGAAIEASDPDAYSGLLTLLIGLDAAGNLRGIQKVVMEETPGLGTKILGEKFLKPLTGKGRGDMRWDLKQDGGDIDAVTAATISSRATVRILAFSLDVFEALEKEGTIE